MTAIDRVNAAVRSGWTKGRRELDRPTPVEGQWLVQPSARSTVIDLLIVTALCAVAVILVFRTWTAKLRVPYAYFGDGLYSLRDAIALGETGWVQSTDRLGAPFREVMYDYPTSGDNGNYLIMWVLSRVIGDPALLVNSLFLLGFFITSWTSYLGLRWMRIDRWPAIAGALVFAFAPYHFVRHAHHLMLGLSYWVVAVGVVLALRTATGSTLVPRRAVRSSFAGRRDLLTGLAICVVCGSFGAYYALLSAATILVGGVLGAIAWRRGRPLLAAAQHSLVIVIALVFNLLPTVIYRLRHGPNPAAVHRQPIEFDLYGLRLSQMVAPVPGHRFAALGWLSDALTRGYGSEPSQFLGLVAAIGLVGMLATVVVRVMAGLAGRAPAVKGAPRDLLAVITLLWILIAMTGGLNWLLSAAGFGLLRAWGRVSILIAFASIAWLALLATERMRRSGVRSRVLTGAAAIAIAAVALLDQTSSRIIPDTARFATAYQSDRRFFGAVESMLQPGAMVYQLPYRRFPEEPPTADSVDYDLLRPYLHSRSLRWSYGGMKGREADWQENLLTLQPAQLATTLAAIGFDGIMVDRLGYPDRAATLESELAALSTSPSMASEDGRWVFVSLADVRASLSPQDANELRNSYLPGVAVEVIGCAPPEPGGPHVSLRWCGPSGTIHLRDHEPDGANRLRARLEAAAGHGSVVFTVGQDVIAYEVGPEGAEVDLLVPSGKENTVEFETDLSGIIVPNDYRDHHFRLLQLTVLPAETVAVAAD